LVGSGQGLPESGSEDDTDNSGLITFLEVLVCLFVFLTLLSGLYFQYKFDFKSFSTFFGCLAILGGSLYGLYKKKSE